MKKSTIFSVIFLLAGMFSFEFILAAWEEPVLTIYITRHAQRGPRSKWAEADRTKQMVGEFLDGKYIPPSGDSITPLGVKQCELLGAYLKKLNFKGKVYSSPNFRAMQTAVVTTNAIDPKLQIIPEPGLQSGGNRKEPAKGMSCGELQKRFPGKVVSVEMPEKWQLAGEFTADDRYKRMDKFFNELLKKEPKGEVLLVGHSSTIPSLLGVLNKRIVDRRLHVNAYYVWNCCLHIFKLDKNGKVVFSSVENYNYLPEEMRTQNFGKPNSRIKPRNNFVLPAKGAASAVPATSVKKSPAVSAAPAAKSTPKLGNVLKNGDFSILSKVTARNLRPMKNWEYKGTLFPAPWELMGRGKAELKEKAFEGKNVLCVEGNYARLCQDIAGTGVTAYTFTCKAKGNCKLEGVMYFQGKSAAASPVTLTNEWKEIKFTFTVPAEAKYRVLSIRLTGEKARAEFADCKFIAEK
ncbi:MAG: histidine phosphatase family protein [Lentisphaeria bacterium]|nr:histidine phosphatase family protein [Lentisphaeria bacterium]